jgi:hypothetical protein
VSQDLTSDVPDWAGLAVQPQEALPAITHQGPGNWTDSISLPQGTHSLGLTYDNGHLVLIEVQGVTTGCIYLGSNPRMPGSVPFVVPIFSAWDKQVHLFTQMDAAEQFTVWPTAILDAEAFYLASQGLQPQQVDILTSGLVLGQQARINSLPVAPAADRLPAPWELAVSEAKVDVTVNGTTPLVAPSGALHVYVFGWSLAISGSQGGVLAYLANHRTGVAFAHLSENGSANAWGALAGNEGGWDTGAGGGVDLVTVSVPTGGTVRATTRYTQPSS